MLRLGYKAETEVLSGRPVAAESMSLEADRVAARNTGGVVGFVRKQLGSALAASV